MRSAKNTPIVLARDTLIYTKDLQKDEQTLLLPVYMTPLL